MFVHRHWPSAAKGKKHREARRMYHHHKYYRQLCHHCRPDITAMVDWA